MLDQSRERQGRGIEQIAGPRHPERKLFLRDNNFEIFDDASDRTGAICEAVSKVKCDSMAHEQMAVQLGDNHGIRMESSHGPSWSVERWLIRKTLRLLGDPVIGIRLWDGVEIASGQAAEVRPWIRISQRQALWKLLLDPAYYFFESFIKGGIDIDGDMTLLLCELNRLWRLHHPRRLTIWLRDLCASLRRHSVQGSRRNAARHYDLGNDFYRLWLDEQLVYTCAYFPSPGMTLEAAQIAKMDHVCGKLRLKPGEEVVEAGCGWGALALHLARHYGVRVRAYNVSVEQLRYARQRAQDEGLVDRVEFIQDDWRNITGNCDAFVSVGMLEHVGPENYPRLGKVIQRCLSPHGRGLIHTIGQNFPQPLNHWIERKIFPGAQPPALEELAEIFSAGDLTVLDVENIRLHYAETLHHWLERFERSIEPIREMYGEEFVRMWRMYLVSSYSAFETGGLQLYQVLFAPTASNDLPRTRDYQYQNSVEYSS